MSSRIERQRAARRERRDHEAAPRPSKRAGRRRRGLARAQQEFREALAQGGGLPMGIHHCLIGSSVESTALRSPNPWKELMVKAILCRAEADKLLTAEGLPVEGATLNAMIGLLRSQLASGATPALLRELASRVTDHRAEALEGVGSPAEDPSPRLVRLPGFGLFPFDPGPSPAPPLYYYLEAGE